MNNNSEFNKTPYSFEFPVPSTNLDYDDVYVSNNYATIEECVTECKAACEEQGVNYDDRDVKLFMTDVDGKWEVTEEGELAG